MKSSSSLASNLSQLTKQHSLTSRDIRMQHNDVAKKKRTIDLSDLIGQFGLYQLNVMLFTLIREATTAMDSFTFSLSLPPELDFQCVAPDSDEAITIANKSSLLSSMSTSSTSEHLEGLGLDPRCHYAKFTGPNQHSIEPCQRWQYFDANQHNTLSVQYDLVCGREWLGSMVLTSFFVGQLLGNFLWGPFADRYGRWTSNTVCHFMGLMFSSACLWSPTVYWLIFFRFGSAFCAMGYYVLNTLQVEIIGTKYRTFTTTCNHLGWGLGIMCLAFVGVSTNNWRHLASICPSLMILGLPQLLIMPESIRWLLLHGKVEAARKEIKRAAKFNFVHHKVDIDTQIDRYLISKEPEDDMDQKEHEQHQQQFVGLIDLFKNRVLCFNLVSLWLAYLISSFIYYSRTLHFAPDKAAIFANFMIAGAGEWTCLFVAATFMYFCRRKTCLALFIGASGLSFLSEGLISQFTDLLNASPPIAYTLDAFAKISAMSAIMVLFLVSYEVFPTQLRNRGASLILTALTLGGIVAPFSKNIEVFLGGQLNYDIILACLATAVALVITFLVSETKNTELADTISESEEQLKKKQTSIIA